MRDQKAMKWIDLVQPHIACQNSLLTTLCTNIDFLQYVEQSLDAIEDDSELTRTDLQQARQDLMQVVQAASAIMKMQHDTLMSLIQNMR